MKLLRRLENNKGVISSALGKEIAKEVLDGNLVILSEAIELCKYNLDELSDKNIRAGAAKIVEIVAEKMPELVGSNLNELLSALQAKEPQTRWMIIRTFGFCAKLNDEVALKALPYAKKYLSDKEGLIIASSADLYLGDLGAVSKKYTDLVWNILRESEKTCVKNEQDWLLESYMSISENLSEEQIDEIIPFMKTWEISDRKATQKRVKKLFKLIGRTE